MKRGGIKASIKGGVARGSAGVMNGLAELEGEKGCDEGFGEQNDNEKKASGWRERKDLKYFFSLSSNTLRRQL